MTASNCLDHEQLRGAVRRRHAAVADSIFQIPLTVINTSSCYDATCAIDQLADLPSAAVLASFRCGNPTALAELKPGETVLDLAAGGGIDVLLSARRVGPTGLAYATRPGAAPSDERT